MFGSVGVPELLIILLVVLLLFGGKQLPELARSLGKGLRELQKAARGAKEEMRNFMDDEDTLQG